MLSSRAVRVVFAELSSCLVRKYLIDRRKLALILLCALFPLVSASQKVWGQATINQFEVSEVNFPAQLVGARILGINDNGDLVGIDPQGELFLHLRGTGFRRMAGVVPGQLTSLNGFNNAATSLVRYRSSTTGSLRTGLVRSNRSFSVVLGPQTSSQLFIPIALGATDTVGGILAGQLGPVMCQASSCQSYRVSGQVTYASVEDVNERGTIVGSISTPTRGQVATRFYPNREEMLQIPQVIGASYAVNISSNDAALVVGDVGPSASSCFGQSPCLRSFVVDNAGRSFRLLDPKHWREHYQQVNSFLQVPGIWRYGSVNRYWTPFLYWAHSTQSIRFEALVSGHVTFGTGVLGSPNGDYWVVFGLGGQSNYRGNTAVDLMILRRRPQPALSLQIDPYKHRDTGTSVRVIPVGQPAHITIEGGVPGLDVYVYLYSPQRQEWSRSPLAVIPADANGRVEFDTPSIPRSVAGQMVEMLALMFDGPRLRLSPQRRLVFE